MGCQTETCIADSPAILVIPAWAFLPLQVSMWLSSSRSGELRGPGVPGGEGRGVRVLAPAKLGEKALVRQQDRGRAGM